MSSNDLGEWVWLLIGLAGVIAVLVSPIVAAIKTALGERLPARYYPTVSVAVGIILAELVCWIQTQDYRQWLLVGVLAGLGASGLFALGKRAEMQAPRG